MTISAAPAIDEVLPLVVRRRAVQPSGEFLREVSGASYSYADVHAQALVWASALERVGVEAGQSVVMMLPTGVDSVFTWLGTAWLGAVTVPVNTAYRGRMLSYVLADSAPEVVVVSARCLPRLLEVWADVPTLRLVIVPDAQATDDLPGMCRPRAEFLDGAVAAPRPDPAPSDLAAVLYTSGTTGVSKGVMVTWRHLRSLATGMAPAPGLGPGDVLYLTLPVFHGSGTGAIFLTALGGGTVVLREHFSATAFWADIEENRCTTTVLMGSMAHFVLSQAPASASSGASSEHAGGGRSCLRNVLMVPVPSNLDEFRDRLGVRVHTWYGLTEAGAPVASVDWVVHGASCGRARPGFQAIVVDDRDEPVAPGVPGELLLRSDVAWTMTRGYWNKPEATVELWRNLWLHTGDRVRMGADGQIYFLDRMKDAIRRRGENISSLEVEREVDAHPAVAESAAFAVPAQWGEDEVMVAVVRQPGCALEPVELHDFLLARLPHFMIPRYIEFVAELPRTPTAKVQKSVLRQRGVSTETWDREAWGIQVRRS